MHGISPINGALNSTMKTKLFCFFVLVGCLAGGPLPGAEEPRHPSEGKPAAQAKGFKNVGVDEFEKLRGDKQNRVLDVRTAPEFATGHMPGAINLDVNAPDFEQ